MLLMLVVAMAVAMPTSYAQLSKVGKWPPGFPRLRCS